jgi:hypothetical protein
MSTDAPTLEQPMCNAILCEGVVSGTCVMVDGETIVYAGPFKGCPDSTGKTVLLSAADFAKLKALVDRKRN